MKLAGCMDLKVSLFNRNDKETETFVILPDDFYPDILLHGTLCEKLSLTYKKIEAVKHSTYTTYKGEVQDVFDRLGKAKIIYHAHVNNTQPMIMQPDVFLMSNYNHSRKIKKEVFSKVALKTAIWRILVAEESSKILVFTTTPFGRYRFWRMSYGIASAQEVCQRSVTQPAQGLRFVKVNVDDILQYSRSEDEHKPHLGLLLQRLCEQGFQINSSKCEFGVKSLTFLGFGISDNGVIIQQ